MPTAAWLKIARSCSSLARSASFAWSSSVSGPLPRQQNGVGVLQRHGAQELFFVVQGCH